MKTRVVLFGVLVSMFFLSACLNRYAPGTAGIGEAEFMLSVAPRSAHAYHFKKAGDYLRRAKLASANKDAYKASYYASLSVLESRLLMALSSESMKNEQLNNETGRMEETEKLYSDEKKEVVKLRKQLLY